jgi:hypothetical protein
LARARKRLRIAVYQLAKLIVDIAPGEVKDRVDDARSEAAAVRSMRFAAPRAHDLIRDGVEHQALALMLWRAALPADALVWKRQG